MNPRRHSDTVSLSCPDRKRWLHTLRNLGESCKMDPWWLGYIKCAKYIPTAAVGLFRTRETGIKSIQDAVKYIKGCMFGENSPEHYLLYTVPNLMLHSVEFKAALRTTDPLTPAITGSLITLSMTLSACWNWIWSILKLVLSSVDAR